MWGSLLVSLSAVGSPHLFGSSVPIDPGRDRSPPSGRSKSHVEGLVSLIFRDLGVSESSKLFEALCDIELPEFWGTDTI